ncbi:hypothetical protein B0H21DRAFT_869467, partial [Amylocystis lapponica]
LHLPSCRPRSYVSGGFSENSQKSTLIDGTSFKGRLVERDGVCVVCHAQDNSIVYDDDFLDILQDAHIVPLSSHQQWVRGELSRFISDPYTSPEHVDNEHPASSHKDVRRMYSLENGLLLCANHHIAFGAHGFLIRPHACALYLSPCLEYSQTAADTHHFRFEFVFFFDTRASNHQAMVLFQPGILSTPERRDP